MDILIKTSLLSKIQLKTSIRKMLFSVLVGDMYKQQNIRKSFFENRLSFDWFLQYIIQVLDKRDTRQLNTHFL